MMGFLEMMESIRAQAETFSLASPVKPKGKTRRKGLPFYPNFDFEFSCLRWGSIRAGVGLWELRRAADVAVARGGAGWNN